MIFEFITKKNNYGRRRYLAIDTEARVYSTECRSMVPVGVELATVKAYRELVERCECAELKRVDYVC